uniref:Uncharacterized protein n=1 Tax=Glossina pallidipes TaxID=7398 RepID=A0A1A9ZLH0_GLOPL
MTKKKHLGNDVAATASSHAITVLASHSTNNVSAQSNQNLSHIQTQVPGGSINRAVDSCHSPIEPIIQCYWPRPRRTGCSNGSAYDECMDMIKLQAPERAKQKCVMCHRLSPM